MLMFMNNVPKKSLLVGLIFFLTLGGIMGCSSKPSASDAKRVFNNLLKQGIFSDSDALTLISLKKTNAQETEMLGVEQYYLFADVEIKSSRDTRDYKKGTNKDQIQLIFTKTEKGWQGQDGNIY